MNDLIVRIRCLCSRRSILMVDHELGLDTHRSRSGLQIYVGYIYHVSEASKNSGMGTRGEQTRYFETGKVSIMGVHIYVGKNTSLFVPRCTISFIGGHYSPLSLNQSHLSTEPSTFQPFQPTTYHLYVVLIRTECFKSKYRHMRRGRAMYN